MSNPIIQGSQEWKAAKQSKIGGSEIFTLVYHYCAKELQEMGFDLTKEKPFRTIQELFLKVKFGAELSEIDPVHSEFGNEMEAYVAYRLGQELPKLKIERSKEFIVNEKLHALAACSPDGYLDFGTTGNCELDDFDKTCKIHWEWGKGALELKTTNYFANFDQGGSRLQYIMQLQYQIAVMGLKWGCLAVLLPKQKEFDEPFFKGTILERLKWLPGMHCATSIDESYDLKHYIYPTLPGFQALILKALNSFQNDLHNPEAYPRNSEDLPGIQREKKMLGQLYPDKFGTLEVTEESEIDDLLNQRMIAQGAMLDAEKEMRNCENQLIKIAQKYCEVRGSKHRLLWIKNGQVRFYKLKQEAK